MSETKVIYFFLFHVTGDESLCFWCWGDAKPQALEQTFFIAGCQALRLETCLIIRIAFKQVC